MERLYGLGLSKSVEEDAYRLRQLFADNVQSNEEYQSVAGVNPDRLNEETELFRERGTYSGNLGDLRFAQMCLNYQLLSHVISHFSFHDLHNRCLHREIINIYRLQCNRFRTLRCNSVEFL